MLQFFHNFSCYFKEMFLHGAFHLPLNHLASLLKIGKNLAIILKWESFHAFNKLFIVALSLVTKKMSRNMLEECSVFQFENQENNKCFLYTIHIPSEDGTSTSNSRSFLLEIRVDIHLVCLSLLPLFALKSCCNH